MRLFAEQVDAFFTQRPGGNMKPVTNLNGFNG